MKPLACHLFLVLLLLWLLMLLFLMWFNFSVWAARKEVNKNGSLNENELNTYKKIPTQNTVQNTNYFCLNCSK